MIVSGVGCRVFVLLILIKALDSLAARKRASNWLLDYENKNGNDFVNDDPNASSLRTQSVQDCPPQQFSTRITSRIICSLQISHGCTSHSQCTQNKLCCYNGCVWTCTEGAEKPALVDWFRQPPKMSELTGNAWLVKVDGTHSQTQTDEELCYVPAVYTPLDAPLLCPHGFLCKLRTPGNAATGRLATGVCIDSNDRKGQTLNVRGANCKYEKKSVMDGSLFNISKHMCTCEKGDILCAVH